MPKDPNKPGQLDQEEDTIMLDDGDVTFIDTEGEEIPIDEALAESTDPDMYPPRAVQEHVSAFESLKSQLTAIIHTTGNGKKTAEHSAKNPLTCFLDGMEVPVRKAVRIAQSRRTLTDPEIGVLSNLIDVNLLNTNISIAQAAEMAARPKVLEPNEFAMLTTFKETHRNGENTSVGQAIRDIKRRKALTDIELTLLQTPLIKIAEAWLEESLRASAKYTNSGSHPEAIARMERRMAAPLTLTANVCLLENGHKETEHVSLAELIIIYEDTGLISAEDAVAQTSALRSKLAKLGLTPAEFKRKFESSKKNRIKDVDIQKRLRAIEDLIDSPEVVSHYILNETTRTYEEVSIGDMITALFEELDLLPEDEEKYRKPLEDKYNSKLEDLGRTREEVTASIPTPLGYINGESTSRLSVFDVLHSDIEESRKDPNSTFTTYIETEYGLEEFPLLKAIALAVEMGYLSEELAQSLSKSCETAMLLASHRSGSKMTKPVMAYHKTQAKPVWRRIKEKKNPPKKYILPRTPSAADLLEEKVATSEGEIGNASFYPLKEILEARVAGKITREQAREFVERTVAACTRETADSVVEAYSLVEWILRLHYMSEALELLDLMPISEEDKRETREFLSDETPSAASTSVSPEEASDEFSVYNWQSGRGLTSSLMELDGDEENIQKDLRRTAILASLREAARSPLSIILATAAAVMLLSPVAVKVSKKAGLEGSDGRMETYEQGPNGETIIKDEAGSIIAVYPPEPEEQQIAMAVPSIPDTLPVLDANTSFPEDISFPVVVQTSTPSPEDATSYASAIPDTFTGKPDTFSGELMSEPTVQPPPIQIARPQIEKPATLTLTPEEQSSIIKTAQSSLDNVSAGVRTAGSNLALWMQTRIERTKAGVEKLRTQIAQYHQKEILELAQLVARMQQKQMEALDLVMATPIDNPRKKDANEIGTYGRRPIELGLSPLPRLAETESRQNRRTEPAEAQPSQLDAETAMAIQETILSTTAKISQTAKSLTAGIISWTKIQADTAKAGLKKLEEQIAIWRQKEVIDLARQVAGMRQQQIEALKLVMATPINEPRQKDANEIGTRERFPIESTLAPLPAEPEQVAQAPTQPIQPEKPAAQPEPAPAQPPVTPIQPSPEVKPPAQPIKPETPETREVQIPIATTKTATGFTIDAAKSYALWKERGWQGAFIRRAEGASFVIIIPDKKTGKSYKAEIPTTYASALKTVTSTANLLEKSKN